MVHASHYFIALIVQFESMSDTSCGQCCRNSLTIFNHSSRSTCVGIKLRITKVATIFLKDEMFTIEDTN